MLSSLRCQGARFNAVLALCVSCALAVGVSGTVFAGDDDDGGDDSPTVRIHGSARLSVPEGSEDEDASGWAHLRQRGERMAIHVFVRGLEPGATYGVVASRTTIEQDGEGNDVEVTETADLGTITTRDATPSAPRCFHASLNPPETPDGGDGGEEEGGGASFDRDTHRSGHDGADRPPHGVAFLHLDREGTSLSYTIATRRLEGAVVAAALDLGGELGALDLELAESRWGLSGSVDVSAEQVAALASGEAVLAIATDADEELSGAVEACFSETFRERIAERRSGSGALRLDTENGDVIPFVTETISELEGVTIDVTGAEDAVVLTGTVGELRDLTGCRRHWGHRCDSDDGGDDGGDGGDGGDEVANLVLAAEDEEMDLLDDGEFFGVFEPHDASFRRGDVNRDLRVDISDAVSVLLILFDGRAAPYCPDAADANDDGTVNISDAIAMLGTLFKSAGPLQAPYVAIGFDPSADTLLCDGDQ